jgi:hypothetical protein
LRWICLLLWGAALAALALPPGRDGQAAPVPKGKAAPVWPKTTPGDRKRSTNNLKQIGLAFHNCHDTYGGFPAQAFCSADGKPLLSWRVALLPFLEDDRLYTEFKLDEAWDSPHNKKLLARMPAVYGLPGVKVTPDHGTFYRVFTGADTPFNPAARRAGPWPIGTRMAGITDGTSNTILVVEAGEAVPWTKPDDLAYDPKKPLPKLGGLFPEGFHILLADGSVRYLGPKVREKDLRALITPAGGEVIDWKTIPLALPPAEKK